MQIACSSRSFGREIPSRRSLLDFPAWCGSRGFDLIEIDDAQLPSTDADYLTDLRRACERAQVRIACLALHNDFTIPDPDQLADEIACVRDRLAHVAIPLGASLAVVEIGLADKTHDGDQRALEAFRALTPDLETLGITLALENHARMLTPSATVAALVAGVPTRRFRACVDLGSLPSYDRELAEDALAPLAGYVHARSYGFDLDGEEIGIDYKRAFAILTEHGYDGIISVLYDGLGNEEQGVLQTKALIEKHWFHPEARGRKAA